MSPYFAAGQVILPEESFPTQFLEFIPGEGELFDPDETLTVDHFDQQTSLLFTMDAGLDLERSELGKVIRFDLRRSGIDAGRILLAEGQYAPGVRVYVLRLETGLRRCDYFLQPGWRVHSEPAGEGSINLRFVHQPLDATTVGVSGYPAPWTSRSRRRRGGPRPTPKERRVHIISGWLQTPPGETQEEYCARHGVSASTLRTWIRDLKRGGEMP